MASDLDQLLDMGFEKERAEIAVKKGGNLQGAIDWLDKNQEKSLEDIKAAEAEDADDGPALQPGEAAKSLVCDECGKRFRSTAQAEYHGNKSGHENFSESTEEIKPLTEEEKAAKLEELKERARARKSEVSEQEKLERKRNEEIRRKSTKETQAIKEDLQMKEKLKEAAAKKREKQDEIEAKKRVQAKIAADREERRLRTEKEKAARSGQAPPPSEPAAAPVTKPAAPAPSKPAAAYTEARLRLQTPTGTVQKTLPADTTLFELAHMVAEESGVQVATFTQNFPKKIFDSTDFGQTLKEAGLVPSAALIVK